MLSKWKILNPKHRGLCPRPRKPRKGLILNKFKCLNSKIKTNLSLKEKIFFCEARSLFLSFGFWILVLFSISGLEFRNYIARTIIGGEN